MSERIAPSILDEYDNRPRHAEYPIRLDRSTEWSLGESIETLARTLELSATPTVRQRTVTSVPLQSHATTRYHLLDFTDAEFKSGVHKTTITLPGYSLTLEGSESGSLGVWRNHTGAHEGRPLSPSALVTYISQILPESPMLDALIYNATSAQSPLTTADIREALWQDTHALSNDWSDSQIYEARQYLSDQTHDYTNMISAVLRITQKQSRVDYHLRSGTELPIVVTPHPLSNYDTLDDIPLIISHGAQTPEKTIELYQQYRLGFSRFDANPERTRAFAILALESHDITATALDLLALSTALDTQENRGLARLYTHAMALIESTHLKKPEDDSTAQATTPE